jgi:hypothetical protein
MFLGYRPPNMGAQYAKKSRHEFASGIEFKEQGIEIGQQRIFQVIWASGERVGTLPDCTASLTAAQIR